MYNSFVIVVVLVVVANTQNIDLLSAENVVHVYLSNKSLFLFSSV